ncbi:ribulose phosphate epimerase [Paraliomyxa miuraensis]|uniref:ribulose phosphate epimerase n=1 Tax=Paraliomyxa miuraensis TaxID=376150 RepID=UPI0022514425|nr:ribulose phosphate epimerase [Paraliomyxa miuraensis]
MARVGLLPSMLLLGCVSNTITLLDDDGSGGSGADGPSPTTTDATLDPTSPSTTTFEPTDDTAGLDSSTGLGFVPPLDGMGGISFECSIFQQDCPPGEKCMPWANDGGSAWNATRCSPLAEDPAGVEEPCMVEGSGTSGIDDCELGTMCWDVDPETNEGVCVPLCMGSAWNPFCADPGRQCAIASDGAVALCLPICDPIAQDCPDGQACYPIQDSWSCAPDASGDMGVYGDPCEFINVCDSGLVCLGSSAAAPGLPCEGAAGCCLEICAVSLGDAQCTGIAGGEICQPWYEEGSAPIGFDDVGVCALPA